MLPVLLSGVNVSLNDLNLIVAHNSFVAFSLFSLMAYFIL